MDAESKLDLDSLKKIDDVSECIQRLATSADPSALESADALLRQLEEKDEELRTKNDRTVINKDTSHGDSRASATGQPETDAFLREIERDASERAERRQRNRKRAAEWKDRGNEHFKLANYAKAVDCYTKGIEIAKDFELLYQNRANCYVKQGRYAEALTDAEAAIFLTQERCAKAFFHQAKALTGLDRLDEARAAYKRMAACPDAAPGHADRCTAELDRLQSARADEAKALAEFNAAAASGSGSAPAAATVDMLIYRLARGDQPLTYYATGMRLLAAAVQQASADGGVDSCSLFRAKSGFNLLGKQRAVVAALDLPLTGMGAEQLDLLTAALTLAASVANGDAENCHRLLQLSPLVARATEAILRAPEAADAGCPLPLRRAALQALGRVCEQACDRHCDGLADPAGIVAALLGLVRRLPPAAAADAARLLASLAGCARLRERLQRVQPARLGALTAGLESLLGGGFGESLAAWADAVGYGRRLLVGCQTARAAAAGRTSFLAACEAALAKLAPADNGSDGEPPDELHQNAVSQTVALLACAALEATPAVTARSRPLAELALRFAGAVGVAVSPDCRQFALALLATLAPREPAAAAVVASSSLSLGLLARVLDSPDNPSAASALRVLAAVLRDSDDARRRVGDDPRWLDRLLELLNSRSDCLLGNAALCLGECLEETAAAELLARTDIVRLLLCRMRDCGEREAKANCAKLCGRLAQSHHAHRERLRELDGVNILNSVLVNNNIRL